MRPEGHPFGSHAQLGETSCYTQNLLERLYIPSALESLARERDDHNQHDPIPEGRRHSMDGWLELNAGNINRANREDPTTNNLDDATSLYLHLTYGSIIKPVELIQVKPEIHAPHPSFLCYLTCTLVKQKLQTLNKKP